MSSFFGKKIRDKIKERYNVKIVWVWQLDKGF